MISVSWSPKTSWSASISLLKLWLTFLWGILAPSVHSGLLKRLADLIVHESFQWRPLVLYSFLSHFPQLCLSLLLLPTSSSLFPSFPVMTLLPPPALCSHTSPQVTSSRAAQQQQAQTGAGSGKKPPLPLNRSLSLLAEKHSIYNKLIWHCMKCCRYTDDIWRHWKTSMRIGIKTLLRKIGVCGIYNFISSYSMSPYKLRTASALLYFLWNNCNTFLG